MTYYLQTNLISIILVLIIYLDSKRKFAKSETAKIIMNYILWGVVLMSVSDIFAFISRGNSFIGVNISNIVYNASICTCSYLWFLYMLIKLGYTNNIKKSVGMTVGPLLIILILLCLNGWTDFFFTIDADNIYHRGNGIAFMWLVSWLYLMIAFGVVVYFMKTEKSSFKRKEARAYLVFWIPIVLGSLIQMLFYGVTSIQIGSAFSLMIVYLNGQTFLYHRDALTGLNNKNDFFADRDNIFIESAIKTVSVFIIHLENIKFINDIYGHIRGDQAIKDIAEIIVKTTDEINNCDFHSYRYSGSRFIVVGLNFEDEDNEKFVSKFKYNIDAFNIQNKIKGNEYNLNTEISYKSGECADIDAFESLFYDVKNGFKK